LLLFQTERSFASKSRTGNQQCILIHYWLTSFLKDDE
jgi:hypothetical protein